MNRPVLPAFQGILIWHRVPSTLTQSGLPRPIGLRPTPAYGFLTLGRLACVGNADRGFPPEQEA